MTNATPLSGAGPVDIGGARPWWRVATVVLVGVLLVLATVLTVNHGSVVFPHAGQQGNPVLIFIDGVNRSIMYRGAWTGYVGPSVNDTCTYCPVGAEAGGAVRVPLATWSIPQNASFWIFTNVSGPFLVQAPGCSPAPCTFPWLKVWSYETYVQQGAVQSLTLFATFKLPGQPADQPNFLTLNATFCPVPTCPAPS